MQTYKPIKKYVDNSLIILCQVHTRKTRFNILWITLLLNFNQWRKDITGVQTTYKDFNKVKKKLPTTKKLKIQDVANNDYFSLGS